MKCTEKVYYSSTGGPFIEERKENVTCYIFRSPYMISMPDKMIVF